MTNLGKMIPVLVISLALVSGCGSESKQSSQAQQLNQDQKPIAVDVAIARLENLEADTA